MQSKVLPQVLPQAHSHQATTKALKSSPSSISPLSSQLDTLQQKFPKLEAAQRIEALSAEFGSSLVASTSAGAQSAVLLDLLARNAPQTPVIWVDTGYHFGETYSYLETLKETFSELNWHEVTSTMTAARQEALYGKRWEQGSEALQAYNLQNKVEPMNRALNQLHAKCWISGLRAQQSQGRAQRPYLEAQNQTLKAYPILDWSDADIDNYLLIRELPRHPLTKRGYLSIGDWHSSRPANPGESAEATRFDGQQRECGLHELSNQPDFQI